MCKSIAEGGLRCASHTRPAYATALAAVRSGTLEVNNQFTFAEAAQAYAATPAGRKAATADIQALRAEGKDVAATVLAESVERGHQDYLAAKEATRLIEQEQLRSEVVAWARNVPAHQAAMDEYKRLLSRDLGVTDESLELLVAAQGYASANEPSALEPGDLAAARYITIHEGQYVGTPIDSGSLRMMADLERLAAEARRNKRATVEYVDLNERRWVRYENDHLSEVLRAVHYDPETRDLTVVLTPNGNVTEPSYRYRDVHPSMFEELISSRSMGRLYSYAFSRLAADGSMGNATANDFSFAIASANALSPIGSSTGPVPVKMPRRLSGEIVNI